MNHALGCIINKFCHTYTKNFSYDYIERTDEAVAKNIQTYNSRRQLKNDFNTFRLWQLKRVDSKLSVTFLKKFAHTNYNHSVRLNEKLKMRFYSIVRGFLFLFITNSVFYLVYDERNQFFGIISLYTDGQLLHWAQGITIDKRNLSSLSIYLAIAIATKMKIPVISLGPTNDETKKRRGFQRAPINSLLDMKKFNPIPYRIAIKSEMSSFENMFDLISEP